MDPTHLSADFRDFLICLNAEGVEYLVVGGHAVAYYGYVGPTRDLDVWVAVSPTNADRLVRAVNTFFGEALTGLTKEWFLDFESVTRFGSMPNLIEILPRISGSDFDQAFPRRVICEMDGLNINLISLPDLIVNKRASGRLEGHADVQELMGP